MIYRESLDKPGGNLLFSAVLEFTTLGPTTSPSTCPASSRVGYPSPTPTAAIDEFASTYVILNHKWAQICLK